MPALKRRARPRTWREREKYDKAKLAAALHSLPREERYRTLGYYDELIDDRMEDGQSEEDAVASLGEPQQVAREILGEEEPAPSTSRGRRVWLIVLLVLGFPLWGSLLLVAAIVLLCLYICLFLPAFVLGVLALGCLASALVGVVGTPVLKSHLAGNPPQL